MDTWISDLLGALGYFGVAALMFLENVFPPLPSEVIMPLSGFAAGQGRLTLLGVIIAGSAGSLLGQFPLYFLGRSLGEHRIRAFAERHGRWFAVTGADIDRAAGWLRRHGAGAVFVCRFVPGVRSLISIPAGVVHLDLVRFTLFSAAGIIPWTAALAGLGYLLGSRYEAIADSLGLAGKWALGALALAFVSWIGWRYWRCRKRLVHCPEDDRANSA